MSKAVVKNPPEKELVPVVVKAKVPRYTKKTVSKWAVELLKRDPFINSSTVGYDDEYGLVVFEFKSGEMFSFYVEKE